MESMEHSEDIVTLDEEETDRTPDWAPRFRKLVEYMREEGYLEELDRLVESQRRADGARLIDVVVFLVAYFCANPSEDGLRGFWKAIRKDHRKLAALAGRRKLVSSSAVGRREFHRF